jgi:hypothetical protein
MQALGQLTGLSSLELDGFGFSKAGLAPLEALQRLTSLRIDDDPGRGPQDAAVLGRLGALRTMEAAFAGAAAVAAAGLHRLQGVTAMIWGWESEGGASIQLAAGSQIRVPNWKDLRFFDASQVHVLEMHDHIDVQVATACVALRSCPQLRGLRLKGTLALHPQVLQIVAGCSHLTSLHLGKRRLGQALAAADGGLAALAQGCSRLRRLALQGIEGLSADMLSALMRLPCLRLLRLLSCGPAVGQEQCQAFVGRLGLQELQVDVDVVADGALRARWMMERLFGMEGGVEGGGDVIDGWSGCQLSTVTSDGELQRCCGQQRSAGPNDAVAGDVGHAGVMRGAYRLANGRSAGGPLDAPPAAAVAAVACRSKQGSQVSNLRSSGNEPCMPANSRRMEGG